MAEEEWQMIRGVPQLGGSCDRRELCIGQEGDVPGRGIAYQGDENEIGEFPLEIATALEDIACMYAIRTSVEIARFCR